MTEGRIQMHLTESGKLTYEVIEPGDYVRITFPVLLELLKQAGIEEDR